MYRIYIDFMLGHEYSGYVYETEDGKGQMICDEDAHTYHLTQKVKLFETKELAQKWLDENEAELEIKEFGAEVTIC